MTSFGVREDLVALHGYHSAQVDCEVRLNTNESPFPPSSAYLEEFSRQMADGSLNRYPDRRATELRRSLAAHEGVAIDEVFCANGSNEVIQSLLLAYGGPGRRALVFTPTYALHSHIARVTGTALCEQARGEDFALSADAVAQSIKEVDPAVCFLCSPNNPTGGLEPIEVVEAALDACRGLVIVDEAYGQFAPRSAFELRGRADAERMVLVRTFSKTWGLAGARLGYALAQPPVIDACFDVALPYHLSTLTQLAGTLALKYDDEMRRHVAILTEERGRLEAQLAELELTVWPSSANFILFRPEHRDGHEVWEGLVERSVLVRDCSSWEGLEGCLRVTVGTRAENEAFMDALREVL